MTRRVTWKSLSALGLGLALNVGTLLAAADTSKDAEAKARMRLPTDSDKPSTLVEEEHVLVGSEVHPQHDVEKLQDAQAQETGGSSGGDYWSAIMNFFMPGASQSSRSSTSISSSSTTSSVEVKNKKTSSKHGDKYLRREGAKKHHGHRRHKKGALVEGHVDVEKAETHTVEQEKEKAVSSTSQIDQESSRTTTASESGFPFSQLASILLDDGVKQAEEDFSVSGNAAAVVPEAPTTSYDNFDASGELEIMQSRTSKNVAELQEHHGLTPSTTIFTSKSMSGVQLDTPSSNIKEDNPTAGPESPDQQQHRSTSKIADDYQTNQELLAPSFMNDKNDGPRQLMHLLGIKDQVNPTDEDENENEDPSRRRTSSSTSQQPAAKGSLGSLGFADQNRAMSAQQALQDLRREVRSAFGGARTGKVLLATRRSLQQFDEDSATLHRRVKMFLAKLSAMWGELSSAEAVLWKASAVDLGASVLNYENAVQRRLQRLSRKMTSELPSDYIKKYQQIAAKYDAEEVEAEEEIKVEGGGDQEVGGGGDYAGSREVEGGNGNEEEQQEQVGAT
ncbi:unnamed protein product [Amoebophrya sp. A25]|nr:unnamed protein product [Amoebophrya sp. A25]|eukprot:GSA25T00014504001.1